MSAEYPLEELASLPSFYHPTVSPDGSRIAFYYDETGRNELYVQDLDTGDRERVSEGNVPRQARHGIAWDADGEGVFLHVDDDGDEQNDVHRFDLDSGESEPLVAGDGQSHFQTVSDDGRWLFYTSTAEGQMNVHRYDRETETDERITDYDQPVHTVELSPDGERIAYTTNESDDLENSDVYVACVERSTGGADGSAPRKLDLNDEGFEASLADWQDERLLVGDDSPDTNRVGVYDLDAESVEWFDSDYEERPVRFLGTEADGDFLVLRFREAAVVPLVYEDGEARRVEAPLGVASFPGDESLVGDGTVLLQQTTPNTRPELLRYDLADDSYETLVEADYGDIDPDAFADCEFVTYESEDGLDIGALHYDARDGPAVESDATTVPAIVMVHGGPHAASFRSFNAYAQFLVSRGYTVLQPNYRGSIGRGREFKNAIHHDWGGMEQVDVREGAAWLREQAYVDDDRIAVFGGSYGGYSAYCQLTMHPEAWTTGVAWIGITDLQALYEESMPHFKTVLEQQLGDPEENAAFYRERSPITHVEEMTAPILMVHGVNDPRCPISQARRFRDALEDQGWEEPEEFQYEELGEEGHGSSDIDQKIRAYRIMAEYLAERMPATARSEADD
ncbi:S9 family peptidase [Halomarina oriensis]|uniref:Prolyl oligopeptidase family serine peptidase n=1 Tax=Halomarina oriensis TaxID=671145 RepID=A0A6B0GEL1_9EURY|nr:LpqB family beta-propeller domain-containing protein [Halomarina oriensis]MWG33376.1 prolyl oligopeptidase family serine peptidase [Halomarina oriensis]